MKLIVVPVIGALVLASDLIGETFCSLPQHHNVIPAALAQAPKKELPSCLAEIAKATVIEDGALRSSKLKDSLLAAQKLGPGAKEMLIEIAQNGTPAGRLISLALLKSIAPGQYQKLADALKQELGDQSVSYISPSERCHYSVSDILNDMASSKPSIKMLPTAGPK